MTFSKTSISELWVVDLDLKSDARGFFARVYCESEFAEAGLCTTWGQCNLSQTTRVGTVRGLHWQAEPHPEIKLVRCVVGCVWDCIVDVRPASPTFGKWEAFELSCENHRMLYVGAGLAHGFQVMRPGSEMYYQMSTPYVAGLARGLRWDDPSVDIEWPLEITGMSDRDMSLPGLEGGALV